MPAAVFAAISRRSPLVSLAMIDGDLRRSPGSVSSEMLAPAP
jgi:hypothetical protein